MSRSDERASKEMYEQRTAMLPFPIRQELVGKRFIVITEEATRRSAKNRSLEKQENYSWKQGYIRACSVKDIQDKELQVLVEFDGATWEYRQWIKIFEQTKAFFVENTIVWAARVCRGGNTQRNTLSWPALIFVPLVDYLGFDKDSKHPVEYFGDKQLAFLKENEVRLYKDGDENLKQVFCLNGLVQEDLTGWQRLQKTQACLMNGAETLTGARVTVYRLELRQWYTGCITAHNLTTRELHVMDDNVLQTHPVHPALVQINLMANDDELLRILHGEQTKMLPTRRQRNAQIYFQSNCPEQKSQAGVTNWHMVRDLNVSQPKPGWGRPSVVRTVSRGKPAFVPSVASDLDGSLPKQSDPPSSNKDENHEETSGGHSAAKVKVHKPIPVVLKRSDSIPFPHYTPQPPRSSTSPLLSSLNSTTSPRQAQFTPSPLSSQHTPSPPSLRNQTPPQDSKNESPFNISLCDRSSARAAVKTARNNENHRTNLNSQSKPITPSRKSNVIETTDKNKTNSRLVPSPSVLSPSTEICSSSKNSADGNPTSFTPVIETTRKTPPQITPRTMVSESSSDENSVRNISPESETPPTVLTKSSRNFVPRVETQRKKKTHKKTPPTLVVDNLSTVDISSVTQQRSTNTVISPERGHSSRMENERARSSSHNGSTQNVDTNPISAQTENIQSRGALYSNTQECSHLRTIARIQLDYLLYLEELVRFQHRMVVEAINTLNQTVTEEQFLFVADFFCKLVERNRNTENIFREASFSQQERQRAEHQRHLSQGTATSPNRAGACLPEEISTKLRLAHECVKRKREEVMSVLLPFEEWQQKKGQQREWEVLKQRLQKQHQVDERRQAPRQGQAEAEKSNNLQGQQQQQQQQDKVQHQGLSGVSSSSDTSNQVEMSKEIRISEEQRKKAREEPQQTSRVESSSSVIQSPPQDGNRVLQATRSELSWKPHNFQQLQPLMLQREQLYEQKRYDDVQKKMVDELFQMKDVEQKTILLQHIVQALQSQKASSRDVLKSPPTISSNFGNRSTESQLTKVQNRQNQYVVPREVNQTQTQHVPETSVPLHLSADQLLSSLTTSPSTVRRVTETLGIAPVLISEKQSTVGKTQVSRNSEKCNSEVVVEKEISTSGNTSIIPDVTSVLDTSGEAGSKKDKPGSTKTSTNKGSAKKRKTSLPGDSETLPKPKRQRKSTKKKSVSDIASQDIASLDAPCQSCKQEKIPVKSVPPGETLPMTMTSGDRNVTPVKANDEQFSLSQYHPRSITKGIGFVTIKPVHGVSSTVTSVTLATSDSLDVLASVSTSLRTNERSVIQSFVGKKRLPDDGSRQFADENQQQSSGDSPTTIDGNQQLTKKNRERVDDSPTSINDNRQPTKENQQHNAVRKDFEIFSISTDRTQIADVGASHTTIDGSQMLSDGRQSHDEPNQSATTPSADVNQGGLFSDVSDIKTDLISDQHKVQISPNSNQMVKDKTVDINSVGLNGSVKKPKKPKKERQKKEKKPKTQRVDSTVETTPKAKDGLSVLASNTARDVSLFYLLSGERNIDGNKSNEVFSKMIGQLSSTHGDENKTKQTTQDVNALSLDHGGQNGGNPAAVKSTDIMMKGTDEPPELSTLKHLVPGSLTNADIPKQSTKMEMQDSSKPMDPTCAVISQDIQPLNLYNETLLSNKSTDETLALKGKQKNVEISSGKKSGKKESKVKPGGAKTKKPSEKKSKTPRTNKQEKDKSTKKSSKVLTKTKETDNKQADEELGNDKLINDLGDISPNIDAIQISSSSDETTMLSMSQISNDATKMVATMFTYGEFINNEVNVNSLEEPVASAKESRKSDDKATDNKPTQSEDSTEDLSSISHKSVNSEMDSSKELIHNKEDDTVKNTSVIAGETSVSEVPKKRKNKTGTSKPHTKKSASEKSKKNPAKEEKSTKNNKKPGKKSEKNNLKYLGNNSVTTKSENQAGTACAIKDSIMAVDDELVVVDEGDQRRLVQDKASEETYSVTTDADVIEKWRDSEDIVFINDQSIGNFVKAKKGEDGVFSKGLSSRKRKRCTSPQINDSVVSESSDVESCVSAVRHETTGTDSNQMSSKKPSSRKCSESGEKKETKVRRKKVKKENAEKEAKNESEAMDTSTLNESMKQDEKTDSTVEAKKKIKKAKNPNEKKVRERTPKEEWVYFLQRGGCKALPSMPQCRECRNYETEEEAVLNRSCCRFHMFRRCRSKSNKLEMAGFSSSEHAHGDDLLPWMAGKEIRKLLSLDVSKYILLNVGDEFCNLVHQEEKAFSWEAKKDIAWKRAVRGIREMCDACATTIFNVHWVCPKCGFGVCLDCYRARMEMSVSPAEAGRAKRFLWVRCSSNTSHRPQRLVLTHIIPKKTLHEIGEQLHEAREFWGIGKNCPCKRQELEDSARIQELPDDVKNIVVDVVDEKPSLLEQDKDEAPKSVEENSEVSVEIKIEKITEMDSEANITSKDTNETLVKTEIPNPTETIMPGGQSEDAGNMLPESQAGGTPECEAGKQPELGKSAELDEKYQPDKPPEDEAPECKDTTLPACRNISPVCDKAPASEVDKQHECKDSNPPRAFVEKSSDVNIVGDGIGALSLLMDYESPASSPMSSPVQEMVCEDITEITPAEEALLSRPCATHGESSAMTSTSSETAGECSEGGHVPSETSGGSLPMIGESSEMTGEPSAMTGETSVMTGETSVMTGETSAMTGETSAMTGETSAMTGETSAMTGETSAMTEMSQADIIARVEARTTDEIPAPHSWICRRPMLRLHAAHHEGNLVAFQLRWQKGEPVLVSGVHKNMTSHLWTPEGFENEFGSEKADVVNCKNGGTLEKLDIGTFWRGFESVKDRPLDNKGEPTLLKLKDWPPEADFVEKMPTRFKDLMDALPLPEYTRRDGTRNLVARLPDFFVKPDLGPKMYNAYGNAAFPSAGTTNLHIDMSDAVNVMVYVGVPFDEGYGEQERRDSFACIDVACDETQQCRARGTAEKLGALWHIFAAEDANKIRALFHKVCREKNMKYPASHDPIHDQCFYLDEPLLKRLKDEYGVVGWPIAQFLGDAIFIPAGAPHQVRNLHSCVKAAEDFVSPEHVGHCFKLTEEFRHLSEKHTNHEDKLQVKNIIYHAVKDAVNVLRQHEIMPNEAGNEDV